MAMRQVLKNKEDIMNKQAADSDTENIEGLGENSLWGDYPIDTLLIRNENRTVHDILRRIEKGSFIMNPDFQRDFIWPEDKQSKLIESVLMRIPLPVFYLAEDDQGRMIVVDGLQRLSTFRSFLNNELSLKLPKRDDLNKMRFQDLSPKLQNRIEDCNLILYVIDAKVTDRARLDIFERVNAGVPLTRQQMRNCLYMGNATRFLKEEANTDIFKKATGGSLKSNTMRDREFINRYCAFKMLPLSEYRGDMDKFLADCLIEMNSIDMNELKILSSQLRTGLINNYNVFGEHAFRKHEQGQNGRSVINASLWDIMSTGLSNYSENIVESRADKLRASFYPLLTSPEFALSITYATNDLKNVHTRFEMSKMMFKEVFNA